MPVHKIEVRKPAKQVLNSDIELTVYSDGMVLGELRISRGSIDRRLAKKSRVSKWTWEQSAAPMDKS